MTGKGSYGPLTDASTLNKIKRAALGFLTGVFFLSLTVLTSHAGVIAADLESALQFRGPQEEIPVVVTLADKVDLKFSKELRHGDRSHRRSSIINDLKNKAKNTQGPLKAILKSRKTKGIKDLWIINGVAVTLRADLIPEIAALPEVETVQLDSVVQAPVTAYGTAPLPEWNLDMIGAPELWNLGYTGQGVVLATMDTGVDIKHPDLETKWRGGTNSWYDPNGQHVAPADLNGHGTQIMGIMVGGDAGGTAIGVAPDAQWIAAKIYNDAGTTTYSVIHQAFQWLLDPDGNPDTDDAPDVVNISWDTGTVNSCNAEFEPDVQALKAAGIVLAMAAGNSGPYSSTSTSPANYPESFAVGSLDQSQRIAFTSSRGPASCDAGVFPELIAPGVNVKTSDLTYGGVFLNSYAYVSGTSFSAPHVAGTMALLLSAFPTTTVTELESALKASAFDLGAAGPDNNFGYGLVDALEAYNLLFFSQHCTDEDGDGFYGEADCGTEQDCNDNDAGVYPGAPEIKHDGIDQDCNGYDLTIDITKATYRVATDSLVVHATSDLGDQAGLRLEITLANGSTLTRNMAWNAARGMWEKDMGNFQSRFGSRPVAVRASGIEGSESSPIQFATITITRALYRTATDRLVVHATSEFGEQAGLRVVVTLTNGSRLNRNMVWNATMNRWEKVMLNVTTRFGATPTAVRVFGSEGTESSPVLFQ
jgi:serine protease AprX